MTNLSQSSVTKRIAQQIKLIRYIPEHRVYELAVKWEHQEDFITRFLPEIYVYPFVVKTQKETQETKVSEQEHQIPETQNRNDLTVEFTVESIVLGPTQLPNIAKNVTEISTNPSQQQKQLNYDQIISRKENQVLLKEMTDSILRIKQIKGSQRKKRK